MAGGGLRVDAPALLVEHRRVEVARRRLGDGEVVEVGLDRLRIALHGIAEPAAAAPAHRVDVGGALRQVLLPELQVHRRAFDLGDVLGHLASGEPGRNVAVGDVGVAIGGRWVAAHQPWRGGRRIPRRQRVLHDHLGVVGDETALGRHPAAEAACASGVRQLLAVQEQHREALLGVLDVRELADGGTHLSAGVDSVGVREGADGAADRIDQDVAVALAPLIDAPEDRARPLAGPADAEDIAAHLRIGVDHLRDGVVGGVEGDLHRLDRSGGDRRREVCAVERARRRVEVDVAERAADREVLVPAQQLVDGHHHRAAPARVRGVHGAVLRRAAVVLEGEPGALLADREHHPVGTAIARPAGLDVGALLPLAVRQAGHLLQIGLLRVVDDALHHPLDHGRPVALDELEDARPGGGVARELRPEVERHHLRLSRRPQVELLDVAPDDVVLDDS